MSGFKHRGEDIKIDEGPSFKEDGYTVDGNGKVIYKSETRFSRSYADRPDKVLEDAKKSIDKALDPESAFYDPKRDQPGHRVLEVHSGPRVQFWGNERWHETGCGRDEKGMGWSSMVVDRY